jgi:hypothetical protein
VERSSISSTRLPKSIHAIWDHHHGRPYIKLLIMNPGLMLWGSTKLYASCDWACVSCLCRPKPIDSRTLFAHVSDVKQRASLLRETSQPTGTRIASVYSTSDHGAEGKRGLGGFGPLGRGYVTVDRRCGV